MKVPSRATADLGSSAGLRSDELRKNILQRLRERNPKASQLDLQLAEEALSQGQEQQANRVLPLGIDALDELLPQRGLVCGSVSEVRVEGGWGAATSFALAACRAAQNQFRSESDPPNWCAFVDPEATLFAPGVAHLGVRLERLLVLRPPRDAVERVAVRLAEARLLSLIVIDARGWRGSGREEGRSPLPFDVRSWARTVRRLSLAIRNVRTCVLLLTPRCNSGAWSLPVASRFELSKPAVDSLRVRVTKERTGRITPARIIVGGFEPAIRNAS